MGKHDKKKRMTTKSVKAQVKTERASKKTTPGRKAKKIREKEKERIRSSGVAGALVNFVIRVKKQAKVDAKRRKPSKLSTKVNKEIQKRLIKEKTK